MPIQTCDCMQSFGFEDFGLGDPNKRRSKAPEVAFWLYRLRASLIRYFRSPVVPFHIERFTRRLTTPWFVAGEVAPTNRLMIRRVTTR
jgi:hypothetical protein